VYKITQFLRACLEDKLFKKFTKEFDLEFGEQVTDKEEYERSMGLVAVVRILKKDSSSDSE